MSASKSHMSCLEDERFVRDVLQKSRVKSPKRAFRTSLPQKVTRQVSKTSVSYETSSKSHASSLQNEQIQNERFARDFLKKSRVKSPKRALRTRLPQKVTRQVSKTSASYETSSKSHASTLQNERFVRDFLQTQVSQVSKTSASYETSSKSHASTLENHPFIQDSSESRKQTSSCLQQNLYRTVWLE